MFHKAKDSIPPEIYHIVGGGAVLKKIYAIMSFAEGVWGPSTCVLASAVLKECTPKRVESNNAMLEFEFGLFRVIILKLEFHNFRIKFQ